MRTFMVTTLAAVLGLLANSPLVFAQENRPQQDRPLQTDRDQTTARGEKLDSHLASCLAIENWAEIEAAKFGEARAQSEEVKQFANMLQKDHTEFLNRLKSIEPEVAKYLMKTGRTQTGIEGRDAAASRRDAQAGETRRDPQAGETRRDETRRDSDLTAAHGGAADKMLQIKQEIAETCINTFQQELGSKSKADFDRCFVGYQVGAHLHMLDTLKVFEKHASPQLAEVIRDGSQSVQQHLAQAKQLLTRFESKLTGAERASEIK